MKEALKQISNLVGKKLREQGHNLPLQKRGRGTALLIFIDFVGRKP
jgi:hypothetical protein